MNIQKTAIGLCFLFVFSGTLFALATEQIGPAPEGNPHGFVSSNWSDTVKTLALHPSRVYSRWVNGAEDIYFKTADIQQLNDLLAMFSTVAEEPILIIRSESEPNVQSFQGQEIEYNLRLRIPEGIYLQMAKEKKDPIQWPTEPQLLLISQPIKMQQLEIPKNILVILNDKDADEASGSEQVTQEQVVTGNTQFALDLYTRLSAKEGNLFFSPYSISTALAMTYAGARSDTKTQMMETLHFFRPDETFHALFGGLEKGLNEQGRKGDYQLSVANALWVQKDFQFLKSFLDLNREHYSAALKEVDYRQNPEEARKIINTWVEEKTNDKIKDLIPEGVLDAMTRLVLTNAIYFKGDWASQFDKAVTVRQDFYLTPRKAATVPLMFQKGDYKFSRTDTIQMLELPYKGEDLSMLVLLPKEKEGLGDLEKELTAENLTEWQQKMHKQEVLVFLPKFTMTYECELNKTLEQMGMPLAFSGGADFSGMTGRRDMFISNVIHKAFVAVDEEGTEAAAATGVVMKLTAVREPPPTFRADHPFVFLIKDNKTGSILFMGRVADPTKEE